MYLRRTEFVGPVPAEMFAAKRRDLCSEPGFMGTLRKGVAP